MYEFSFSNWLLHEAARGPNDLAMSGYKVTLSFGQTMLWNKMAKHLGDLSIDLVYADTKLLPGYKLFMFHSEAPKGWGPLLYDITMEVTTLQGGHLISNTLVNRLKGRDAAYSEKGFAGGDSSDAADNIYKFYTSKREDVVKTQPDLSKFISEEELRESPYKFYLYSKPPTTLQQLIELNKSGKKVFGTGNPGLIVPIMDLSEIKKMTEKHESEMVKDEPTAPPTAQPTANMRLQLSPSGGSPIIMGIGTQVGKYILKFPGGEFYGVNQFKTEKDVNYWYIVPSPGNPNITFLNNKPLNAKTAVKDGDVVAVGNPQTMKTAGPMRVGFI